MRKWVEPSLLLGLFAAAVYNRFSALDADAAFHLSESAGVYFDQFSHSANARSYVQFGKLLPDQWNTYVYSPIYVLLQVVWFSLFGISIKAMNAYGATYSLLTVVAAWFCFRRVSTLCGFLAVSFFSFHYIFCQFGRNAYLENPVMLWMIIAAYFLAGDRLSVREATGVAFFSFLALVFKHIAFYILIAAFFAVLLASWQKYLRERNAKEALKLIGAFLGTVLVCFSVWMIAFRIPNGDEISRIGTVWWKMVRPDSFSHSMELLANFRGLWRIDRHDYLNIIAILAAGVTTYLALVRPQSASPLMLMLTLCVACGFGSTGVLDYRQTRFTVIILPAIFGLVAIGISKMSNWRELPTRPKNTWFADLLGILTITFVIRYDMFFRELFRDLFSPYFLNRFGPWDKVASAFVFALVIWSALRLLGRLVSRGSIQVSPWIFRAAALLFCLQFFYGNISAMERWRADTRYSIRNANERLAEFPAMVVAGISVHAATFETEHRPVRVQFGGWHNDEDIFNKHPITHVFVTTYYDYHKRWFEFYPEQMSRAKAVASFRMCDQLYRLYELAPEDR